MRKQVMSRKYYYFLGEDLKTQIMKVVLITLSVLITLICFEINRSDFDRRSYSYAEALFEYHGNQTVRAFKDGSSFSHVDFLDYFVR